MKLISAMLIPFVLLLACSETDLENLDSEELKEIEQQVEADAKSLEEAADEAVKALEEDIQAELDNDGVDEPLEPAAPTESVEAE